jgi:hypothetical protein
LFVDALNSEESNTYYWLSPVDQPTP